MMNLIYQNIMENYIVLIGKEKNLVVIGIINIFIILKLDYIFVQMVKLILLIIQIVLLWKF